MTKENKGILSLVNKNIKARITIPLIIDDPEIQAAIAPLVNQLAYFGIDVETALCKTPGELPGVVDCFNGGAEKVLYISSRDPGHRDGYIVTEEGKKVRVIHFKLARATQSAVLPGFLRGILIPD